MSLFSFIAKDKIRDPKVIYEELYTNLEEIEKIYKNANTNKEVEILKETIEKSINLIKEMRYKNTFNNGEVFGLLLSGLGYLSYTKGWIEKFKLIGLKDLRKTNSLKLIKNEDGKFYIQNYPVPQSIVRFEEVEEMNISSFKKKKILKEKRKQNRYQRNLGRKVNM